MSTTELSPTDRVIRGVSGPVTGMVLFVAGEAMFFAAFFAAYFSLKAIAPTWPPAGITPPDVGIPSVLTGILVASSVVIQFSVRAVRRGNVRRSQQLLVVTAVLGICFLALQAYDYTRLTFGIKDGIYPSLFYVMTGLHMAHVAGGVALLFIVGTQSLNKQTGWAQHETLQSAAIYWDFVDVVWILLFLVFYVAR